MFGSAESAKAQEHVEAQGVIAAEALADGIQIDAGGAEEVGIVLIDGNEEAFAASGCRMRGQRDAGAHVIVAKGYGSVVDAVVRAKAGDPVARAVGLEVIRKKERSRRPF